MPIIRKKLKHNFTIVPNSILQNKNLSYEARGVLSELLSRPNNWVVRKSQLITESCGKTKLERIFRELRSAGYIRILRLRENGKIVDNIWDIYDSPCFDKNRDPGNLTSGKSAPTNTDINTNTESNTNIKEINKENVAIAPQISSKDLKKEKTKKEAINILENINLKLKERVRLSNGKTPNGFRIIDSNLSIIIARLNEGYSTDDLNSVVLLKFNEWANNDEFKQYLTPTTLFKKRRFGSYLSNSSSIEKTEDISLSPKNLSYERYDYSTGKYDTITELL